MLKKSIPHTIRIYRNYLILNIFYPLFYSARFPVKDIDFIKLITKYNSIFFFNEI